MTFHIYHFLTFYFQVIHAFSSEMCLLETACRWSLGCKSHSRCLLSGLFSSFIHHLQYLWCVFHCSLFCVSYYFLFLFLCINILVYHFNLIVLLGKFVLFLFLKDLFVFLLFWDSLTRKLRLALNFFHINLSNAVNIGVYYHALIVF